MAFSVSIFALKLSNVKAHQGTGALKERPLLRGRNGIVNDRNLFDLPSPFDFRAQSCHSRCNAENDAENQQHSPFLDACPKCKESYASQHCNSCCQGGASSLHFRWYGCPKGELTFATGFQGNEDCGLNPYAFHPFPSGYFKFIDCDCYRSINSPATFKPYSCALKDFVPIDTSVNDNHVDICIVATQQSGVIDFTQSLPEFIGLVHSLAESEVDQDKSSPYPLRTYFTTTCSSNGTPLFPGYGKFANSCPSESFIDLEHADSLRLPEDIDHFKGQPPEESFWFEFRDGTSAQFWPRSDTEESPYYSSFDPSFSTCSCTECPSIAPSTMIHNAPSNEPSNTPTKLASEEPSFLPTNDEIPEAIESPTAGPTHIPSSNPTDYPSRLPTFDPTDIASSRPTVHRTKPNASDAPSNTPTKLASDKPSFAPTKDGLSGVTESPTNVPFINIPTIQPTVESSSLPTVKNMNSTGKPTSTLTSKPTDGQSPAPNSAPIKEPSRRPTSSPTRYEATFKPTKRPNVRQSPIPTGDMTKKPTLAPISLPAAQPSMAPTNNGIREISEEPTVGPSNKLTDWPTATSTSRQIMPTGGPTNRQSVEPNRDPTIINTDHPSMAPSINGSREAPEQSTSEPKPASTIHPTDMLTNRPSIPPTDESISMEPTATENKGTTESPTKVEAPTEVPTIHPTKHHCTKKPSLSPSPSTMPTELSFQTPSPDPTNITSSLEPSTESSTAPTGKINKTFSEPPSITPSYSPSDQSPVPSAVPSLASIPCEDETLGSCNEFAYTNCKLVSGSRCFYYHPVVSKEHIMAKIEHHASAIENLRENLGLN